MHFTGSLSDCLSVRIYHIQSLDITMKYQVWIGICPYKLYSECNLLMFC